MLESDSMWYSDKVYILQRNLNYIYLNKNLTTLSQIDRACCGAASIFSHIYLRDLGFNTQIVGILVANFKIELEGAIHEVTSSAGKDDWLKLLWVLAIAGISAFGKSERGWFVGKLMEVSVLFDWGKAAVREAIEKITWTTEWDGYLNVLWDEVVAYCVITD